MKKLPAITVLLTAVLCLSGAARAQEDPPVRVARLSYVSGDVSFQPGGEDDWTWAGINRPMTRGDALWVESGAQAELAIGANVMRLGQETDFSFLDLDDDIVQIQLNSGAISFTVRRLYRGETIEIDTPNVAVLLDEPGTYRIDADPYGDFTSVTAREGRADVLGSGDSYVVDAGTELQAEGTDRLRFSVYDMPPADDLDRFADARDRRFDRSESARYVSFDVTGFVDLDGRGTWRTDPSYGPVWMPRVPAGWAPFRDGTWAWIDPWGWTWIDEADWGYATSHYGRWVRLSRYGGWAWVPPRPARRAPHGPQSYPVDVADRCVYSPANVTFIGTPSDSRVAWFPLAPGEVYLPAFHASITFINQLNITNTTVQINFIQTVINTPPDRVRYVNRVPEAVVVVPRTVFVAAQPIARARVQVSTEFVRAPVIRSAPVAPVRASVYGDVKVKAVATVAPKPPVEVRSRQVVVKRTPPPKRVAFVQKERALAADPGKPVDRKTERTIAAAAPAPAAAPVVKAEAPTAPPKETAQSPKAQAHQTRREIRKVDRNPQARTAPAPAPTPAPQQEKQAPPPPPPPAPSAPDNARQQAEKTQQEQQAARKAEADKRRADQEAAQQQAAQQQATQQQAAKTQQEQQAAHKAEADKRRADQVAAQQQAAQEQATQQQAAKTQQEQQAAHKAEADKRHADQVAAQQQTAKTQQEQQAAHKAEADKRRADEEAARQAQADSANAAASGKSHGPHAPTAAGAPPATVRMTESAQAAKLVSQPDVVPPANAKDVHGAVLVRARIGTDGRVKSAQMVRGPKQLEQAALQNARGRVYQPTVVDGKPVEVDTEITVKF